MSNIPAADHDYEFVGGALALDFSNTLGGMHTAPTHEHLQGYAYLVRFAQEGGAFSTAEVRRLIAEGARHPKLAADVLRRAIALREAIWRVFSALAAEAVPEEQDLALISHEAAGAYVNSRLTRQGEAFQWALAQKVSLERPLWPIARSAVDLLTSDREVNLVRECASETCEWLFVDRTRNHSRRWCDMNDCGNRAKQRRLRQRQSAPRARAAR